LPAKASPRRGTAFARASAVPQADLRGSFEGNSIGVPTKTSVSGIQAGDTAMITKHAIVLAIILGTSSGSLVTTRQHGIDPVYDVYGSERLSAQSSAGPSDLTLIIVAQGRCFNGHCY
jgi:hypothetical protein